MEIGTRYISDFKESTKVKGVAIQLLKECEKQHLTMEEMMLLTKELTQAVNQAISISDKTTKFTFQK